MSGLGKILQAREERSSVIAGLKREHGLPLIVLTLNIPGSNKLPPWSEAVFGTGVREALNLLKGRGIRVRHAEVRKSPAGHEWYAVVHGDAALLKRLAVSIEENHALGRLFDYDVHPVSGPALGRTGLGLSTRKCMLCERPAHECARSCRHPYSELLLFIEKLIACASPDAREVVNFQ